MSDLEDNNSVPNVKSFDLTTFTNNPSVNNEETDFNSKRFIDQVKTEIEHEFICLKEDCNRFILTEGKRLESDWNRYDTTLSRVTANSKFNEHIFVISFVGDTATSKSFLANQLGANCFVFNENNDQGPTTANVTCFESTSFLPEDQNK